MGKEFKRMKEIEFWEIADVVEDEFYETLDLFRELTNDQITEVSDNITRRIMQIIEEARETANV